MLFIATYIQIFRENDINLTGEWSIYISLDKYIESSYSSNCLFLRKTIDMMRMTTKNRL